MGERGGNGGVSEFFDKESTSVKNKFLGRGGEGGWGKGDSECK